VQPIGRRLGMGSTDVGDMSWVVPSIGFRTAIRGAGDTGSLVAGGGAGGMSIGLKGMENASEILALTAAELFTQPELITRARAELE